MANRTVFTLIAAALYFALAAPALAQSPAIRTIVMGEDGDPAAIRRNNDIYKRVIAELRRPLRADGIDVLDEDVIAAELGFNYKAGMEKADILRAVGLANQASNSRTRSHILVLLRVLAFSETLSFTKQAHVRISGELYDLARGQFIDSYETEKKTFALPVDCNQACLIENSGEYARELASHLGLTLGKQLRLYAEKQNWFSQPNVAGNVTQARVSSEYTLTMKNWAAGELARLSELLRKQAGADTALEMLEAQGLIRRYRYTSQASPEQLLLSLENELQTMGLRSADYALVISRQAISLERLR